MLIMILKSGGSKHGYGENGFSTTTKKCSFTATCSKKLFLEAPKVAQNNPSIIWKLENK